MFRASLCPSSGEQDRVVLHAVFCLVCVGCGWLWSCGAASWAVCTVWKLLFDSHSAHSSRRSSTRPQPTTHNQYRTPHAVGHGIILLVMGIMMPETCWDRKSDNKHRISCILLILSLHLIPCHVMSYCYRVTITARHEEIRIAESIDDERIRRNVRVSLCTWLQTLDMRLWQTPHSHHIRF